MADYGQKVGIIWAKVHDLLYGPGRQVRGMLPTMAMTLPERYDQDLLNAIARLRTVPPKERVGVLADVRGKIHVAATVNLISLSDEEIIQKLLDELESN
jgi:hypothetical protein